MRPLIKKELGHFFNNPFGYITLILFGLFVNFLFVKDVFVVGTVSMRQFFSIVPWVSIVFIPAISMRSLAEEKRLNTLEILRTLPLAEIQIVAAKFIVLLLVSSIGLLLTLGLPVSMNILGSNVGSTLYLPEVLIGYIGLILFFAMAISMSMFFSGMTSNQITALLISSVALFILNVLGSDFIGNLIPKFIQDVLVILSPVNQLDVFVKGVIDVRALFYFTSATAIFLFLTVSDLERRS